MDITVNTTQEPLVFHLENGDKTIKMNCLLHPEFKSYSQQLWYAFDNTLRSFPLVAKTVNLVVGYSTRNEDAALYDPETQIATIEFATKPNVFVGNVLAYNAVFKALVNEEDVAILSKQFYPEPEAFGQIEFDNATN